MSSPPPPGLALNPPKKRPSVSSNISSSAQPSKKVQRTHPLRQTSFPVPDASQFVTTPVSAYPRSETGSVASGYSRATASAVDGVPGSGKRGRGRPKKVSSVTGASAVTAGQGGLDDAQSLAGTRQGSIVNSVRAGTAAIGNEEDEEDEGDDFGDVEGDWAEFEENEMKMLQVLTRAFNPETEERYAAYKRVKLKEQVLKRIVNQIVSQSVSKPPLIAINTYTKFFAGEIVERAREVQEEYAKAYDKLLEEKWKEWDQREETKKANQLKVNGEMTEKAESLDTNEKVNGEHDPSTTQLLDQSHDSTATLLASNTQKLRRLPAPPHPLNSLSGFENPHRGGLLPDHLREALRRYRNDGEGGGVGLDGMSLGGLGAKGRKVWTVGGTFSGQGRRIFK